ncbi:cytochrome P450 [Pseudonocardia alni]|uniref:Cytochrome P450 n=1 Tax=Pseudonocardia alni TaxID=33907 RepID=A0A852VV98_PSEA5|nr:cytochrome P450 [Pseudonocardia antarctica]NYG00878.1 cytochrome P450 [Pseudonocardia antarctica]
MPSHPPASSGRLPVLGARDTARLLAVALAPMIAQGVIARRPRVVAAAGRLATDDRSVRLLQDLRDRYGDGPIRVPLPGRPAALVLAAEGVRRVLTEGPTPFAPDTWEKRGALAHFQPHGVLVSHGAARAARRRFTETVLDTGSPLHADAARMAAVAREETVGLRDEAARSGALNWDSFVIAWWRIVRRIVLGDGAREDHALTDTLTRLRRRGNWSVLARRDEDLRDRFASGVRTHLARAEPGSLAARVVQARAPGDGTVAEDQIGHWLFAWDPGAAVALRALALLATHPDVRRRARAETAATPVDRPRELSVLRAVTLESARLWPTTPLLLRESTADTVWPGGELAAGTSLLVPTWFLHRDDRSRTDADRLHVEQWLDGSAADDWTLTPFSGGHGVCPGRELVLFVASTVLATLLEGHHSTLLLPEWFDAEQPLPRGLNPYALRFGISRAAAATAADTADDGGTR